MGKSRVGFLGPSPPAGATLFISSFLEFSKIFLDPTVPRLKRKNKNNIGSYRTKPGRGEADGGAGKEMSVSSRRRAESHLLQGCFFNVLRMNFLGPEEKLRVIVFLHHMGVTPRTQAPRAAGTSQASLDAAPRPHRGGRAPAPDRKGRRLPLEPCGGTRRLPKGTAEPGPAGGRRRGHQCPAHLLPPGVAGSTASTG